MQTYLHNETIILYLTLFKFVWYEITFHNR